MSIRGTLVRWLGGEVRSEITTSRGLERMLAREGMSSAGVTVTATTASGLPAVEASVKVISESLAQLPLRVMRVDGDRRAPATDHWAYELLRRRPNPEQTAFEFREIMTRDYLYRGDGWALKVMSGQRVIDLLRLHPDRIQVEQNAGRVRYLYSRPDGSQIEIARDRLFHLRGASEDGITGINPIRQHQNAIGRALALEGHAGRYFSNGAKPGGLLTQEAGTEMGEDARKALREDFQEMYSGSNAYKTAVLPAGMDFKPVSISNKDAEFIESAKFSITDIARIFRVPPHMIGDLERSMFSNIEHQALEYVKYTLMPHMVRWEQAVERDLLNYDPTLQVKHNANALLRGDMQSRAEALQIQRRNGVISADEWRRLEDMDPRGDRAGEQYIVEQNMIPDDMLGQTNGGAQ